MKAVISSLADITHSRGSRCHWSPGRTRRWSCPPVGWCSVLSGRRRWTRYVAHRSSRWLPRQRCSCRWLRGKKHMQTLFFFCFFLYFPSNRAASPAPLTLTRRRLAALFEPLAGFPLVAFGTGAVEVLVDAVTLGLVLTWVWITGVWGRPAGDLQEAKRADMKETVAVCGASITLLKWLFGD